MLKGDYKKANECGKAAYQFSMNYGDLTLDILNTAALAAGLTRTMRPTSRCRIISRPITMR